MKIEKTFNFWLEGVNRSRVPLDDKVLRQKTWDLYEDFQKKDGTEEETKPFTASRWWLHSFKNRFNLKNVSRWEAVSADGEAGATFPAELKKLSRRENTILGKFSAVPKQACFGKNAQQDLYSQKCKMLHDLKHGGIAWPRYYVATQSDIWGSLVLLTVRKNSRALKNKNNCTRLLAT